MKLALVVKKANCRLFRPEQTMVVDWPRVVVAESEQACARALAQFSDLFDEGSVEELAELGCSCELGQAVFEVDRSRPKSLTKRVSRVAEEPEKAFLSRLPSELVRELLAACRVDRFDEPTVVVREGDSGESFYLMGEGEAEVLKEGEGGTAVLVAVLRKGDCFGEMSLLTGEPASATVRTRAPGTVILSMPRDVLDKFLTSRLTLAHEFSKLIADRLRRMNVFVEREMEKRAVSGRLSMLSAPNLLQMLQAAKRTGTLNVNHEGKEAALGFQEGELVGVVLGEAEGEEAFYELLRWSDGAFYFDPEGIETRGRPSRPLVSLLMEGVRRLDEERR